MVKNLLFALLTLFTLHSNAQLNKDVKKQSFDIAKTQLAVLKKGVLLVRLDLKSNKVAYYEKYNNYKEAEKIRVKQRKEYEQIYIAFSKYFDYCPVYFFQMKDTRHLIEEAYSRVKLYNIRGELDTTFVLESDKFLVAEFGVANQNQLVEENPSIKNDEDYSSKLAVSALVIRDSKMNELKDPFPYFVKYNSFGNVNKRYLSPVQKFQEKLKKFEALN